ncbi:acyltransferase family protein [Pseudomonas segetis]
MPSINQPHIPNNSIKHFYSLDCARGFAALAVVLWHWQHFFFNGSTPGAFQHYNQPFYTLLFPLYEKGWLAVDFFFSLSGFIFFWLYSTPIRHQQTTAKNFFFLRLSRLYPLHILTLLLVTGLQLLYIKTHNTYFIYQANDAYHFALNIFFASAWGLESSFSFNAPIWSVSVEVLLYAIFYCAARYVSLKAIHSIILAAVGLYIQNHLWLVGRGMFAFYMGALAYFAYNKLHARKNNLNINKLLITICLAAWTISILELKLNFAKILIDKLCIAACIDTSYLMTLWVTGILFPMTILTLANSETADRHMWQRTAWLGEISYASYLLHFPLQLVFYTFISKISLSRELFFSPALMICFFILLITISWLTHRHFERPMQYLIRRYTIKHREDSQHKQPSQGKLI